MAFPDGLTEMCKAEECQDRRAVEWSFLNIASSALALGCIWQLSWYYDYILSDATLEFLPDVP